MRHKLGAVVPWRAARDFPEGTVELRKGLEADLKGDLADAKSRIFQGMFGVFDAGPRHLINEVDAGRFDEDLAEIVGAHPGDAGDFRE